MSTTNVNKCNKRNFFDTWIIFLIVWFLSFRLWIIVGDYLTPSLKICLNEAEHEQKSNQFFIIQVDTFIGTVQLHLKHPTKSIPHQTKVTDNKHWIFSHLQAIESHYSEICIKKTLSTINSSRMSNLKRIYGKWLCFKLSELRLVIRCLHKSGMNLLKCPTIVACTV